MAITMYRVPTVALIAPAPHVSVVRILVPVQCVVLAALVTDETLLSVNQSIHPRR